MWRSIFRIAPQCCDAGSYAQFGDECARGMPCYGELRPMGTYLWFSIPGRLGWPTESLIVLNIILMVASIVLAFFALRAVQRLRHEPAWGWAGSLFVLMASAAVHLVFLRPALFNTLSDPPASMLLLMGMWLLILAEARRDGAVRVLSWAAAGLCLGLAAWVRAFFLYPVLAGLGVFVVHWAATRSSPARLLALLALLPIGTQYAVMHNAYGTFSYLKQETLNTWVDAHLNQPFVGYDTVFPRNIHFWTPQHCSAGAGILNGLREGKYGDILCVLGERIYFYLGTYSADTYIFTDATNQLVREFLERIGDPTSDWFLEGLTWESDVADAPDGLRTADKLTVTEPRTDGRGDAILWIMLRGNMPHTFSVWLWSPLPRTLNLAIRRHRDSALIAVRQVTLGPVPQRFSVTGTTMETAEYDVDIGRSPYREHPVTFGTEPGDFFYAWGAQIEVGPAMTEYHNLSKWYDPDSVRRWRPGLLFLNLLMLAVAATGVWRNRAFWLKRQAGLTTLAAVAVAATQAVSIIPEQRFAIALLIFAWLLAILHVLSIMSSVRVIHAAPAVEAVS